MDTKNYRAGIIGSTGRGNYGHGVDLALTKMSNITVAAVADDNAEGLAAAQKRTGAPQAYADYRSMFDKEKLDVVAICPRWVDQHRDMIVAAAQAGCHVYMEKPFCRTLEECDAAVRELEMRHLKLGIAHVTQYSPVLHTVLGLIESGTIGTVLEIRGRGKEDRRGGGEDLWVLGSHIFGLMRSFGGNPTACTAHVTTEGRSITAKDVVEGKEGIGPLAGDHIQAQYSFTNNVTGHFASRRNMSGRPTRFAIQVFGSKGIVEMESGYLKPAFILRDSSWSPARSGKKWEPVTSAGIAKPEPRTDGTYEGGHIAAIQDLLSCAGTDNNPKCSAEDARGIIEMIAAVFESHRIGASVSFPLATRANPLSLLR